MSKHLISKIGVGALIIDKENNSILLSKKNYGPIKDKWTFPEGYVDKYESLIEAIKREMKEELNGDIEVNDLVAVRYRRSKKNPTVYFVFNCLLLNKEELKINDKEEINDFKFFNIEQAEESPEIYSLVKIILNKYKNNSNSNFKKADFFPSEMKVSKNDYFLYL